MDRSQDPSVLHTAVLLGEDIAKRPRNIQLEEMQYMQILWPNLVRALGSTRGIIRRAATKALEAFASNHQATSSLCQVFIKVGLENDRDRIREESARIVWQLFSTSLAAEDANLLFRSIERRVQDPSLLVSRAATATLEHMKRKFYADSHRVSPVPTLAAEAAKHASNQFEDIAAELRGEQQKLKKTSPTRSSRVSSTAKLKFGFVPEKIVDRTKHNNYRIRVGAIDVVS